MNCGACGHERYLHRRRGVCDRYRCPCAKYDASNLPTTGERLEFGRHYLAPEDAEAAPAWPSLAIYQGRRDAAFTRAQKKVKP